MRDFLPQCEGLRAALGLLRHVARPERPSFHPPRGLQRVSADRCAVLAAVRRLQARLFTYFRGYAVRGPERRAGKSETRGEA